MDINMREILLSKEKDGWVYINEIIKGVKTPTTKLLYDDGKYTDNELRVLEQQMRDQNTYNAWELEDDVAATAEYMM